MSGPQLGYSSYPGSEIISAAKWLDQLPHWSIIRNGCDSDAGAGIGIHLIKVPRHPKYAQYGADWQFCDPDGSNHHPVKEGWEFQARDVFLPVQVVRYGKGPA